MAKYSLIVFVAAVVILLVSYLYTQRQNVEEATPPILPTAIPIEVNNLSALEQNGQSLTNDNRIQVKQTLQPAQQTPQRTESNLQGSSSMQPTLPAEDNLPF
jgi:cell division protein YceG involved in septum cleavage